MGFRGRSRKLLWKGALSLWCSETPTVEYEEDILKWSMCCTGYGYSIEDSAVWVQGAVYISHRHVIAILWVLSVLRVGHMDIHSHC